MWRWRFWGDNATCKENSLYLYMILRYAKISLNYESIDWNAVPLTYNIPDLPPNAENLESIAVLKALIGANKALAELKGHVRSIPNQGILIDTLSLQEAKASSEIENIVTTQEQVFQIGTFSKVFENANQKEVARYRDALKVGFDGLMRQKGVFSNNTIISMYQTLKGTAAEFRKTPGTELVNESTGETVYVPPQSHAEIEMHMGNLEKFINTDENNLDPLIRMAIIHHQFESIHPFSDGNGRIGRIINVLYLVQQNLLDTPVLFLSRYITQNKDEYYQLLQSTRDTGDWEPWLLYIIDATEKISLETIDLVFKIREIMADYKLRIRQNYKFYSQDLLNNLFRHPYTRIDYVMKELDVSRPTASRYLEELRAGGFLKRIENGRDVYFVNVPLVALFAHGFGE